MSTHHLGTKWHSDVYASSVDNLKHMAEYIATECNTLISYDAAQQANKSRGSPLMDCVSLSQIQSHILLRQVCDGETPLLPS